MMVIVPAFPKPDVSKERPLGTPALVLPGDADGLRGRQVHRAPTATPTAAANDLCAPGQGHRPSP